MYSYLSEKKLMKPQDPNNPGPIGHGPIKTGPIHSGPIHTGPIFGGPPNFTFTLDSFQITDTRSRHEDTDYVSFTLLVQPNGGPAATPQTLNKSMGDLNNGTFPVGLSFPNVKVGPDDTVVLNYLIVNSGHSSESSIYSTLDSTGAKLASAGASAAAGAIIGSAIPGLGTLIGALAGWLAGELTGVLDANCDGPVAAEQNSFTYDELLQKTASGNYSETTKHPGTDSATGCGSNSMYYVSWHIQKVATSVLAATEATGVLTAR
jgi:hypothetical protein